jgi:hypothetical protein
MNMKLPASSPHLHTTTEAPVSQAEAPQATKQAARPFEATVDAKMEARDRGAGNAYRRSFADMSGAFVKLGAATSAVLGGSALLVGGAIGGPVAGAAAGIALGLTGVPFFALGFINWVVTRGE